jgi:alpha-1,2-mannosyltransferase
MLYWQKNRSNKSLLFAGMICLTIWITPHAMIYDWSILIIPAILFWQAYPHLKPLLKTMYVLIWVVTFLSTPLTLAQLNFLPFAVQFSVPVLFLVYLTLYRHASLDVPEAGTLEVAQ